MVKQAVQWAEHRCPFGPGGGESSPAEQTRQATVFHRRPGAGGSRAGGCRTGPGSSAASAAKAVGSCWAGPAPNTVPVREPPVGLSSAEGMTGGNNDPGSCHTVFTRSVRPDRSLLTEDRGADAISVLGTPAATMVGCGRDSAVGFRSETEQYLA
jgi:hypothetical protein